jgi:hypothetical protein
MSLEEFFRGATGDGRGRGSHGCPGRCAGGSREPSPQVHKRAKEERRMTWRLVGQSTGNDSFGNLDNEELEDSGGRMWSDDDNEDNKDQEETVAPKMKLENSAIQETN